jgi:hypothetical protein
MARLLRMIMVIGCLSGSIPRAVEKLWWASAQLLSPYALKPQHGLSRLYLKRHFNQHTGTAESGAGVLIEVPLEIQAG